MKKKSMLIFIVLFTIAFSIFVSISFFDRNKKIQLNSEFSLEENQLVKIANKDYTNIKLVSIIDKCKEGTCLGSDSLQYKLLVNGKEYFIDEIPSIFSIYENGKIEVIDGDEDRLVLKVVE